MRKIILLITILPYILYANAIQNNQTIIVSSNSTYAYAQRSFKTFKNSFKNQPAFILKSNSGYYMVTTGMYSNKEEVYGAMKQLPVRLQKEKPFRGQLDFALTSKDSRILFTQNLPVSTLAHIKTKTVQKASKIKKETKPLMTKSSPWVNSVSFGYGRNNKHHDAYRMGVQKNFIHKYFESETGYVSGYYDLSLSQVEYSSNVHILGISPVFAYYFKTAWDYSAYVYGGIGAAYISRTTVDEKEFSTAFQFEDQLGFGLQTHNVDFQLGYIHYSNAGIKNPNDGMDIGMFSMRFTF